MVNCTCGLLPNPAKVPNSKYKAWWYSIVRKFHADDEKTQESWIWARALKKCAPCFRSTRNFQFIQIQARWWSIPPQLVAPLIQNRQTTGKAGKRSQWTLVHDPMYCILFVVQHRSLNPASVRKRISCPLMLTLFQSRGLIFGSKTRFGPSMSTNAVTVSSEINLRWKMSNIDSYRRNLVFLEHIFQKWALLKSFCHMSSVRLSVRYFSAGIAPRELKFCTKVRWCVRLNSTVRNFGSVA
jgi:hypothetical protein